MSKGDKKSPEDVEKLRSYGNTTVVMNIRLKPGDVEMITWLTDQLGMSRSDVVRRALSAYAAQLTMMRKK